MDKFVTWWRRKATDTWIILIFKSFTISVGTEKEKGDKIFNNFMGKTETQVSTFYSYFSVSLHIDKA